MANKGLQVSYSGNGIVVLIGYLEHLQCTEKTNCGQKKSNQQHCRMRTMVLRSQIGCCRRFEPERIKQAASEYACKLLRHAEERKTLLFCLFIVTQVPLGDLALEQSNLWPWNPTMSVWFDFTLEVPLDSKLRLNLDRLAVDTMTVDATLILVDLFMPSKQV